MNSGHTHSHSTAAETYTLEEVELTLSEGVTSSKAYVVFEIDDATCKTSPLSAASNNIFNFPKEDYTLHVKGSGHRLVVRVYEKHALRADKVLAEGTHQITHEVKPGKLRVDLMDEKAGGRAGYVAFYMHSSGHKGGQGVASKAATGAAVAGAGTGTGAAATRDVAAERRDATVATGTRTAGGPICDEKFFLKEEDRPEIKETVTQMKEHRPFEKEFVQETMPTGRERERVQDRSSEVIANDTRVLREERGTACSGETVTAPKSMAVAGARAGGAWESGVEGIVHNKATVERAPVCDQQYFTKIEDRPLIKENVTAVREHHPIEKEFRQVVRPTGREQDHVDQHRTEIIGSNTRTVEQATGGSPCDGVPVGAGGVGTGMRTSNTGSTGITGQAQSAAYGNQSGVGQQGQQHQGIAGKVANAVTGHSNQGTGGPVGPAGQQQGVHRGGVSGA